MQTWFLQGAPAHCPKCGHQRFTCGSEAKLKAGDTVICAKCNFVCKVEDAIFAGMRILGITKTDPKESS